MPRRAQGATKPGLTTGSYGIYGIYGIYGSSPAESSASVSAGHTCTREIIKVTRYPAAHRAKE